MVLIAAGLPLCVWCYTEYSGDQSSDIVTLMFRVESTWSGGPIGTGLSVMNFGGVLADPSELDDLLTLVRNFWVSATPGCPAGVSVQVRNEVKLIDTDDGGLLGTLSGAALTPVAGTDTSAYAAGVGGRVRWTTAGFRNGRRVIGTTFIAPLGSGSFENNGTLLAAFVTGVTGAANTLRTAAAALGTPLSVWSRPTSPTATDGVLHEVTGVTVPDRAAWLTSRRS